MEKFYYQQGRCEANHYLSFNPVVYTQTDDENLYIKDRMGCNLIDKGECDRAYTCQLFEDAPATLVPDGVNLRDKNL